jgi:hypothetical protein
MCSNDKRLSKIIKEVANIFRNVFTKVEKKWRSINGRRLPLVMISWEEWMPIYASTGNTIIFIRHNSLQIPQEY